MTRDKLASLAASNKLVPFLGAGCSYGHLKLDWNSISSEMANHLSVEEMDNLSVAEEYASVKGKSGLCAFLENKLLVNEYDDNLDIVPLLIACLGVGLIYSTNQDNVFERCAAKYGRKYKTISTLDDLATYRPADSLYIKYHGDLAIPDTVIFTQSSYEERIKDSEHFLNIRMRSDLLTKSFLFVGYSFRDPNICLIFEELKQAFKGNIPPSFLIAFEYTDELEELSEKYGVTIVNPFAEIADCKNHIEAFEKYMISLSIETHSKKTEEQMDSFFRPAIPQSIKIVSQYEISGLERAVEKANKAIDALGLFRSTLDTSLIPECYQKRVVTVFINICRSCEDRNDSDSLKAAIFNLELTPENTIETLSGVLATAICRGKKKDYDAFYPISRSLDEEFYPLATARAIELVREWDIAMNDSFRRHVSSWLQGYVKLPKDLQSYIRSQIDWAWQEHTTYENPISYLNKVGGNLHFGARRSFQDIQSEFFESLPKQFFKPYEE